MYKKGLYIVFVGALVWALAGCPVAYPEPQAPAKPTLIPGDKQLTVTWDAVSGAASYEVWYGKANDSAQATKFGSDVTDITTIITKLEDDTIYYVWIKAKNESGLSGFSPGESTSTISGTGDSNQVRWTALTADGEEGVKATATLIFTFDKNMGNAFTVDNITLPEGFTKSALDNKGGGTYELSIQGVLASGDIMITLTDPSDWAFSGDKEKLVTVVYVKSVTWNSLTADGKTGTYTAMPVNTTAITFTFSEDIGIGFTADNIILPVGLSKNGALVNNGGGVYTLPISVLGGGKKMVVTLKNPENLAFSVTSKEVAVHIFMSEVLVPAGTFTMGSPSTETGRNDSETQHSVTLTTSFYIGKYAVTVNDYHALMKPETDPAPSEFQEHLGGRVYTDIPMSNISWVDAAAFCNELSREKGLQEVYTISEGTVTPNWSANGYRLPTEAEWEYAARGGSDSPYLIYSGSDDIRDVAWYTENARTHPVNLQYMIKVPNTVGLLKPNALGLYDMSGNMNEWCWDFYESFTSASATDPQGPASGTNRAFRGGNFGDKAENVRTAYRASGAPVSKFRTVGFRVARNQ